jgi:O-antigen ligase
MRQFFREHYQIVVIILLWVVIARLAPPLMYVVLPVGVFLLRRADRWQDILFGFIMCLIFSDMLRGLPGMDVMKPAKAMYILAMGLVLLMDQVRMQPLARLFTIFLPFFVYAFFPILFSPIPLVSIEKTVSYGLLFLVVPNYVLHCFRLHGWDFFRNLIWFSVLVLVAQQLMRLTGNPNQFYVSDRFRGFFGNPNGMAIFVYLTLVLFMVVNHLHRGLFSRFGQLFIYAVLVYYLITCGARTALMSSLMFVLFIQFFRISMLLGIISFVAFIGVSELLASNLPLIITSLGLQDYLRVDTISDGSGRYIAWNYVWDLINNHGYFLFGAGFENEGYLMLKAYVYLSNLGHEGGVHNTYLAFWLNTGIIGLLLYFRSYMLIFIKASKNTSVAMAVMFSVLFSILYESWLAGSLNPYTIMLLVILTVMSEEEIIGSLSRSAEEVADEPVAESPPPLVLPAR